MAASLAVLAVREVRRQVIGGEAQGMATANAISAFSGTESQLSAAAPKVASGLYGIRMVDFMSGAFDRFLPRRTAHCSHKRC